MDAWTLGLVVFISSRRARDLPSHTMEGWLRKKSASPYVWLQYRWFSLRETSLSYFKDASGTDAKGVIPLRAIKEVSTSRASFQIDIDTGYRLYTMYAESYDQAKEWAEKIQHARLKAMAAALAAGPEELLAEQAAQRARVRIECDEASRSVQVRIEAGDATQHQHLQRADIGAEGFVPIAALPFKVPSRIDKLTREWMTDVLRFKGFLRPEGRVTDMEVSGAEACPLEARLLQHNPL